MIETELPRGIKPEILLEYVKNTAPYALALSEEPFSILKKAQDAKKLSHSDYTHADYFRLCVAAHFTTVATFVPTDVDSQIRFKLWHPTLDRKSLESMVQTVLDWLTWDFTPVSTRYVPPPRGHLKRKHLGLMSGHYGEWFSIAVAAFAATRKKAPDLAQILFYAIRDELTREAEILNAYDQLKDGLSLLMVSTTIAHNLGDLDRVIELWGLHEETTEGLTLSFCQMAHKLGHENPKRFGGYYLFAGDLNKALMANENHRFFALRKPKSLRQTADLLLPIGPFFDDWGKRLAKHPGLTLSELSEITECLIDGFEKLKTFGYARALTGIISVFPGGATEFYKILPAAMVRRLKSGELRARMSMTQERFETQWTQMALKFKNRLTYRLDLDFAQSQQLVPSSGVRPGLELSLGDPLLETQNALAL